MEHRTVRGRLAYFGPDGNERGREWFHITAAADGSRVMRAVCEIDDSEVLRDVVLAVGPDWRPLESYVSTTVADRWLGSGWFVFEEDAATAMLRSADLGRLDQRVSTDGRTPMFGGHQVSGDGWQAALVPAGADGPVRIDGILLSSGLPNGASAPLMVATGMTVERIGPERIEVVAGEFDTIRYRVSPDGLPSEELWVLPGDLVLVRSRWPHYETTYELTELVVEV